MLNVLCNPDRKAGHAIFAIDFERRRLAVAKKVDEAGLDAYVGTRMVALHYLGGAFMPWRGMVVVTSKGECRFIYWMGDAERVKTEGPPMKMDLYFLAICLMLETCLVNLAYPKAISVWISFIQATMLCSHRAC